jgi:hypothetical protein
MIEPVLQHNRDEFERLKRRKRRAGVLLVAALLPLTATVMMVPEHAHYVTVAFLLSVGGTVAFFEWKKTIVFQRDLREQRDQRKSK